MKAAPSVTAFDNEKFPRHRWYFFKEAFSPEIVAHAVEEAGLKPKSVVVDPFSGSGTTVLAASTAGMSAIGIEVNPFLRFVSAAKGIQCSAADFSKAVNVALLGSKSPSKCWLETFSTFSENAPAAKDRGKWLFNSKVLRAFQGSWQTSQQLPTPERTLIQLCAIGAAMDAANASKDGKCLRYKDGWQAQRYDRASFTEAFQRRAAIVAEDLDRSKLANRPVVIEGDARRTSFASRFDLCVTSPPYLNSFDYTDVYRPELFLGGFVRSMEQLRSLRRDTVRSHLQTHWDPPTSSKFGRHYSQSIKELKQRTELLWNSRIPEMVQAYFEDMMSVLRVLRAKAKDSASLSLVVSTSAYAGVEIPVDLIIADLAGKAGWSLREVVVLRELRRVSCQQWHALHGRKDASGPFLRESMVVLDAQRRKRNTVVR